MKLCKQPAQLADYLKIIDFHLKCPPCMTIATVYNFNITCTDPDIRHCMYSCLDLLPSSLIFLTWITIQSEKINDFGKLASVGTFVKFHAGTEKPL